MVRGCMQAIGIALVSAAALSSSARGAGAGWTQISSGPFNVFTESPGRVPRQRLAQLDQMRFTLGSYLGKDDPDLVWPLDLILFANQRDYASQALKQPLTDGPDATMAAWMVDTPLPHDLLRAVARRLIEDNSGRMPEAIEQGLVDLMATVEINKANRVTLGAPPAAGELPEPRMQTWAKLQMLATQTEFSGKLRVYLNNLQQGGDEDAAAQNAFGISAKDLDKRAADYLAAGKFVAVQASGPPINPDRDFDTTRHTDEEMKDLLAALTSDGKDFPAESPRGLLAQRNRAAMEQAIKANPRWAAPHDQLATLLGDPVARVKELRLATSLEPRNADYWEDLAIAEEDAFNYGGADKAWKMAERNATADADKSRYRKSRIALDQRQTQAVLEDRRAKIVSENDDVEQVKKAAEARLHAAEAAANKRAGALPAGEKVLPWWNDDDGVKLSGNMTEVECLKGDVLRITVQPATGPAVKLLIPDLHDLAVKTDNVEFACGVQKPPKAIDLVHDGKADKAQGSIGVVHTVSMP